MPSARADGASSASCCVESIVLALAGGLCGLAVARWATGALVAFLSSGRTPIVLDLGPDTRILMFTATVSILTGILCGLVPGAPRLACRCDLWLEGPGARRRRRRLVAPRQILVVSQVALCLLLLFGAGLFVRSHQAIDRQDDGLDRDSVLVIRVEPRGSDQRACQAQPERLDRTYLELLQRVGDDSRRALGQPRAFQPNHAGRPTAGP